VACLTEKGIIMYIKDPDIDVATVPPNKIEGAEGVKAAITLDGCNGSAAHHQTREYEDMMRSSWWNSDSGKFEPPSATPPSRRAAAAAEVQAALAGLRKSNAV
jgi:hypothetical protein